MFHYGRSPMKNRLTAAVAALLIVGSQYAEAQRLPATVVPSHYDLTLDVDLARASFTGEETIRVEVKSPTADITLNAAEIRFDTVTVEAAGGEQRATVAANDAAEQATFHVERPLQPGPATIKIKYTGTLNEQLRGLYLSRANNRRYAVSQLEATDARRMFPCFDEPAMKATFSLTAIVDAADHAISNGAVLSDTPGPARGKHTIKFDTTPRMSTYLVALAVGDFVCRQGSADGTPIRVCATPDKQPLTGYALEAAQQNLRFYNAWYAIKYPFKKLDIVAVPDFSAGAMENTAAIFYRETLLLADPKSAPERTKKVIAEVLAHEMAHQWFGDVVTMQWWDDLWLNEGFANWMETKPLKAWSSGWHSELDEVIANQDALRLDALSSTRPVRTKAETPEEINELFDAIAYNKGAAVLRMVEGYVGAEPFRAGVNAYLQKFQYGNARAEDFWTVMAQTTGKPVDKVMESFVDHPGAPLLSLSLQCAGGGATIQMAQERYRQLAQKPVSDERWDIPACVRLPDRSGQCDSLADRAGTMPLSTCPAWVHGNEDGLGYYRVGYPPEVVRALAAHVTMITPAERLSLIADEIALVRAGKHDVTVALDLASGMADERQETVVGAVVGMLGQFDEELTTPQSRTKYRQWVSSLFGAAFAELGWSGPASEPSARKVLRAEVLGALGGIAHDPQVLARARALVEQGLQRRASIDPELRDTVVNLAAIGGNQALYDRFLAASKAAVANPEEHYRYLLALGRFSDPALVRRTIDLVLSPAIRPQDTPRFVEELLGNSDTNDEAWAVLRHRWAELQKKVGPFLGNPGIVASLGAFCSDARATEIRDFFAAHPVPDAQRSLQQALERIDVCSAVRKSQSGVLADWLAGR